MRRREASPNGIGQKFEWRFGVATLYSSRQPHIAICQKEFAMGVTREVRFAERIPLLVMKLNHSLIRL